MADALAEVAAELYALPPEQFTAARNSRAKAEDDRALAKRVQGLKKPSPAAWVVNLLVRERTDEIDQLLTLGASLREAQGDLDRTALGDLTRQRRQLVSALARQAAALAAANGHRASPTVIAEVEQTLLAALTDEDAAIAIKSGSLIRSLATVGFEPVDLTSAVAAPRANLRVVSKPPPAPPSKDDIDKARREAAEAERTAADAAEDLEDVEARLAQTQRARRKLAAELDKLTERARGVADRIAEADHEVRELGREQDKAARAVTDARREAERARERAIALEEVE